MHVQMRNDREICSESADTWQTCVIVHEGCGDSLAPADVMHPMIRYFHFQVEHDRCLHASTATLHERSVWYRLVGETER